MMKLSVVIAYYNAEIYIAELLDSLLDQGFADDEYEIIVVDDESTHDVSVLKRYCEKYGNIHYVWQKNARQSAARNKGFSIAQGEYLYVCDNDDKVNRQVLKRIYEVAHQNSLDILFFNRLTLGENEPIPPIHLDFELKHAIVTGQKYISQHPDMSTGPWHYIVRRDFIIENHFQFPNGIIICEDVNFLVDICSKAKRTSYLNVDVYYWMQRPRSISHEAGKKKNTEKFLNDMLWYINEKREMISQRDDLDSSYVEWIQCSIIHHSFRILLAAFRFLPINNNLSYIASLKNLGLYPIKKGRITSHKLHLIRFFMNQKCLWISLCAIFHILPLRFRYRYF